MKNRNGFWVFIILFIIAAAILSAVFLWKDCSGCVRGTVCPVPTERAAEASPAPTDPAETAPDETPEPDPEETAVPTETPLAVFVGMADTPAAVKAIATGTYGVASDGSIRFMGCAVSGQNLIYGWRDIVSLAANDGTTAALDRSGKILLTGENADAFAASSRWLGMVDLAMGDGHLVGLRTDGRVFACGENGAGQCDVSSWEKVRHIAAAGNFTAALTENGIVTTLGAQVDAALNAGGEAIALSAASDRILVLRTDGSVDALLREVDPETGETGFAKETVTLDWEDTARIYASDGASFGVDPKGVLHTDSPLVTKKVRDVYSVSASMGHVVVLHGDGTCEGFGDDMFRQCSVDNWRLLPFVTDEGWLLGIAPGTVINGETAKTGMSVEYSEPATGETKKATVVILGDVNGDGAIDDKDAAAAEAKADGEIALSGPFLRAANVITDSAKPKSVDVNDVDLIKREAAGEMAIDQFAKTDEYTAPLASARRKNPDAKGYITIRHTNISYPIMYDFNWYYNDHDIDGNEVVRGSIYFYWREPKGNIVITGHNSRSSGTMFHQLHKVQDNKSSLKTFKDRVWAINTYGVTGYWEVWALYEEPAFKSADQSSQYYNTNYPNTFDKLTDAEKQEWIDYQLERTELKYSVPVTIRDRFMTLVTCGDHHSDSAYGARLYIFLRWVGND